MASPHFTEDEFSAALALYREALIDAKESHEEESDRDEVIATARESLYADDVDAHALVITLATSDSGDRIWSLEEDVIDAG
ncbi:hypothetical protein [Lysinibacter sp. HNR]|uniref:hypothetical protein n=1 Tax=Lysinibacter sp. HNR TaxID=3031408 RepID=UPI00243524FA|nr:hypothetical protein [Lysinibacter sp. HNR]WGD37699.1 hypothetical protein FrondiHNR_01945 [Lysinibacter sp. HNR]